MTNFDDLMEVHSEFTGRFQHTLLKIDPSMVDQTYGESWSPRQIVDHIYQVEDWVYPFITGGHENHPVVRWGPQRLYKALLNRTMRVNSPEPFLPRSSPTWDELVDEWNGLRRKIEAKIQNGHLRFDDQEMHHPFLGQLTRLDWFYTNYFHTERHRLQLEELIGQLKLQVPDRQ